MLDSRVTRTFSTKTSHGRGLVVFDSYHNIYLFIYLGWIATPVKEKNKG